MQIAAWCVLCRVTQLDLSQSEGADQANVDSPSGTVPLLTLLAPFDVLKVRGNNSCVEEAMYYELSRQPSLTF